MKRPLTGQDASSIREVLDPGDKESKNLMLMNGGAENSTSS